MTDVLPRLARRSLDAAVSGAHLVVATDGRPQSDAALAISRLLLKPADTLRLVSVVLPVNLAPESMLLFSVELETERRAQLQKAIAAQTKRVWGNSESAEMTDGDPARSISRLARESGATLIVMGLGRHGIEERLFGDETALRTMRLADTPILAVSANLRHVPRRVVVAVDFSETSLQAARCAIQLAAPGASITLLHVAPQRGELIAWADLHQRHASQALDSMLAKIGHCEGKHLQTLLVNGNPAKEILAAATALDADLIAIGTHGHGLVARFLIGSVATKLVRASDRSILIFPQAAAYQLGHELGESVMARDIVPEQWVTLLNDVSWQNMGRPAALEVDDPELGAQVQVTHQRFWGATFDAHDARIAIMFGTATALGEHFTHSIADVTSVDVLQDANGADIALRIGHGRGQTIITFLDRTN